MKFAKFAKREDSVAKFIPYTRHIDDTTLKTKEGYLLKIIKIEGMPFETADQIDINGRKNIRATLLRGLSNSRFALYHHIIRRKTSSPHEGDFENPWCAALDKAYQDKLSSKDMFINEQYITIIRRPATSKIGVMSELSQTLFSKMDAGHQQYKQNQAHTALNEAVSTLLSTLAPYQPKVLSLHETPRGLFSESLSFLSYLVNFEKTDVRVSDMAISDYLPKKRISFGKESLEIRGAAPKDIKLGAMLSIKEYANGTGPGMLDGLLRLTA